MPLFVTALIACSAAPDGEPVCDLARPAVSLPAALDEASGLALSAVHPGVLYTHDDSGNPPVVSVIDTAGRSIGRIRLTGARNVDWEDIAVAECPAGAPGRSCVYVSDTGDNRAERSDPGVYVFVEPDTLASAEDVRPIRFPVRYEQGPRDAEALFVTGDHRLNVISKGRSVAVELFESAPLEWADTPAALQLRSVQKFSRDAVDLPDQVTAADARGDRVAVRTYTSLQLYRRDGSRLDPVLPSPGVDISTIGEPQGEGLAFGPDGMIYLASEKGPQGVASRLTVLRCGVFDQ